MTLLIGHKAIAAHLDMTERQLTHFVRQRLVPVWIDGGRLVATTSGLNDWREAAGSEAKT